MINKTYGMSSTQITKYGFKLCLEVYEKYNGQCDTCGSLEKLSIHHIDGSGRNKEKFGVEANNNLDNLQLLCIRCHGRIHGKQNAIIRWGNGPNIWKDNIKGYYKDYRNTDKSKEYQKEYQKKYKRVRDRVKYNEYMRLYRKTDKSIRYTKEYQKKLEIKKKGGIKCQNL